MKNRAAIAVMSAEPDIFHIGFSTSMSAEDKETGEVKLYGEIIQNMPEGWKFDNEDKSAADFDKAIKKLKEDGAKKLLLRINSPGGIVNEAVAMRSILANAGFEQIDIRIEGMCASAATIIATLPGCHVTIAAGSEYMIHNPSMIAWGNADDLEKAVTHLRAMEVSFRNMYAKRTGLKDEEIKTMMDAETWLSADDTVKKGFADEVIDAKESPVAACVTSQMMDVMKRMYHAIPNGIKIKDSTILNPPTDTIPETQGTPAVPADNASNSTPKGGRLDAGTNNKEDNTMEMKDITMEQLQSGRPDLLNTIREDAVKAERSRLEDIDALTIPGYEEMAAKAKSDGTSAMDFQKQIVAEMKKKGTDFLTARAQETAPADNVAGSAPAANTRTEDEEIKDYAKDISEYAKQYAGNSDGGMY